jgi:hypothetical protein
MIFQTWQEITGPATGHLSEPVSATDEDHGRRVTPAGAVHVTNLAIMARVLTHPSMEHTTLRRAGCSCMVRRNTAWSPPAGRRR